MKNEINFPIGKVFKALGQALPTTHLSDPHQVFRQLKLLQSGFGFVVKKAHQLDAKYPNFSNQPLAESQKIPVEYSH